MGVASGAQSIGDAQMAGAAKRREVFETVEIPSAPTRIAAMVRLKVVGAVANPALITVTGENGCAKRVPGRAGEVDLVADGNHSIIQTAPGMTGGQT